MEINRSVMIPVLEMDIFINTVQKDSKNCKHLMELCTGSGVVSTVLGIKNSNMEIYAADISEEALAVAESNVRNYELDNVTLLKGDLYEPFIEKNLYEFDIRLSNPSYVKMSEIRNLIKQLKDNAPAFSLDGVQDGLYFFRKILSRVREFLRVGDYIIFENGENQSEELQKYLCSTILELLKG